MWHEELQNVSDQFHFILTVFLQQPDWTMIIYASKFPLCCFTNILYCIDTYFSSSALPPILFLAKFFFWLLPFPLRSFLLFHIHPRHPQLSDISVCWCTQIFCQNRLARNSAIFSGCSVFSTALYQLWLTRVKLSSLIAPKCWLARLGGIQKEIDGHLIFHWTNPFWISML